MKKSLLFSLGLALSVCTTAQTTAQDWTLADCNSNSHTLFTYLDAEEVVVMEFGMGCSSCYTAAAGLMDLKNKYAVDQPGKVNFFYMDYWAGNTCNGDVAPLLAASPLDAGFINCNAQKSYYMSGSPMPGIVIVAGSNHAVIYEKNSYTNSDTTSMITAIDNFFATIGIGENEMNENNFILYPNPAENMITLNADLNESVTDISVEITDITGKIIYTQTGISFAEGTNSLQISLDGYSAGQYFVRVINHETVITQSFLKK